MLSGKRAFDGDDVTDIIAAVVRADPEWSALPPDVPAPIRLLVRRCLDKDRRTRVSDIAVARFMLTETVIPIATPPGVGVARRSVVPWLAAIVAAIGTTAAITWYAARPGAPQQPPVVQFSYTPAGDPLSLFRFAKDLAILPDGSPVYFSGIGQAAQLTVRPLGSLTPQRIGGAGGRDPFVSPDGRWIGYFTASELRKVPTGGGASVFVHRISAATRGGSWGPDDRIVLALVDPQRGGLVSVPASGGGDLKVLTTYDQGHGEGFHGLPFVLANGRGVLYTILPAMGGTERATEIAVLDLRSGQSRKLLSGTAPSYVESGHLLYALNGNLMAAPFDAERLEVTGDAIQVVERVVGGITGAYNYAIARNGTLAYIPDSGSAGTFNRSLAWVTRDGREEAIAAPPRGYSVLRLSPDGTRVALDVRDTRNNSDIWTWDLDRRTLTPLSLDPSQDMSPVWSADGTRIVWTSSRFGGNPNAVWQAADGTGPVERLSTSPQVQFPTAVTPDGKSVLLFWGATVENSLSLNLATIPLAPARAPDKPPQAILEAPTLKLNPAISPNGRWIAYQSNESGQAQIFVRPYPAVDSGRTQISTTGGTRPVWSRDGRELFYLDDGGFMTAVGVETTGTVFKAALPRTLLKTKYYAGTSTRGYDLRAFDVARDGRFLMIKELTSETREQASITVVVNWVEELKARVPVKTAR
jgi:serine/threonine-protein kinase